MDKTCGDKCGILGVTCSVIGEDVGLSDVICPVCGDSVGKTGGRT